MSEFLYKTYRCEWQAQIISVDQYGKQEKVLEFYPFATYEEAKAHLETLATLDEKLGRWVPINGSWYTQGTIAYREVLVEKE